MRKLASIQEVREVLSHPNADLLELAMINGWQCVVKKDEFKAGDKGVYFEIDSFLPASDLRYEFLNKNFTTFEGTYGARIKTIKLRKELSQGLILPITSFPELKDLEVGEDVTDVLGILKYEKPIPISSEAKGNFPSFIEKTDQERVQNLPKLDLDGEWERTEKMDGSSLTDYLNESEFGVCSRNMEVIESDTNPMWMVTKKYKIKEKLEAYNQNIALQGEILGGKIQGNRYQFKEYRYFIFDIYDIDKKRKMLPDERMETIKKLNALDDTPLETVPFLGFVELPKGENWMKELLEQADGFSVHNANAIREGDVYKHRTTGESFKVISNKYLLKED